MTGLRRRANRFVRFCPILTPIFDHLLPGTYAFKLVNDDSEKLQKILKFLHNTPYQGLLEGFSRLLGTHRSLKEALFSTLFLQIFFRIFQNFAPKIPEESPKIFGYPSVRAPKIRHSPSRSPRGSPNIQKISPKIFSNFWGAYMRSASKHTADPAVDSAADSAIHL